GVCLSRSLTGVPIPTTDFAVARGIWPRRTKTVNGQKFSLSGMYKINSIEQKILSAKLKKISIKSDS
ncbi:hypothetical protein, partial [Escherichia coli]|uniref:hypothetical protein n=1 Tax=Escherichia coli TaxID=562 RepID=UPI001BDD8170